jgi:sortase A
MSSIEIPHREDLLITSKPETGSPLVAAKEGARAARAGRLAPSRAAAATFGASVSLTVLTLWFVFHAFVLTPLQEHGSQARLYAEFREELADATAPLGGRIKPGAPVALLDGHIRGLRDLVVVEGTTSKELTLGPGHLRDTPLPGQPGVSVLFGRSVTYGAPFRDIDQLRPGDTITVTTGQGVFTYRVDRLRGPGDPTPPNFPANESHLTLVTSAGVGWRSGWAPSRTIYLDASLTGGTALPAPPGRPANVTKSSLAMRGDTGLLLLIGLWLGPLLIVGAGLGWAWRRWGTAQTWLVGLPIALAVLWGAGGAIVQHLPNLI